MFDELNALGEICKSCVKCNLYKNRTNIVFSDGIPNNKLMLIGEGPGYNEDVKGKPFVGRSGKLLDKIFNSVGLSREKNLYICNIVKCRPPNNREPKEEEKLACREYLDGQINILQPKIIILCGSVAMNSFLNTKDGISKVRGKWFEGPNESKMIAIFHPSYLLRHDYNTVGSPKWLMWQDIQKIKEEYEKL